MTALTLPSGYRERIEGLELEIRSLREKDESEHMERLQKSETQPLQFSGGFDKPLVNDQKL